MKSNISEKRKINNRKVEKVTEEFSGKNIPRFGMAGLIRRFFKRHKIKTKLSEVIMVEEPAVGLSNPLYEEKDEKLYCFPFHTLGTSDKIFA